MSISSEIITTLEYLSDKLPNGFSLPFFSFISFCLAAYITLFVLSQLASTIGKIPFRKKTKVPTEEEKLIINKDNEFLSFYEESIYHDIFLQMTKIRADAQKRKYLLQLANLRFITNRELKRVDPYITYDEQTTKFTIKIDFLTLFQIMFCQLIIAVFVIYSVFAIGKIFYNFPLSTFLVPKNRSSILLLISLLVFYPFVIFISALPSIYLKNLLIRVSKKLELTNALDPASNTLTHHRDAFRIFNQIYIQPLMSGKLQKIKTYFSKWSKWFF